MRNLLPSSLNTTRQVINIFRPQGIAFLNIGLTLFVVFELVLVSALLTRVTNRLVVDPLTRVFANIRRNMDRIMGVLESGEKKQSLNFDDSSSDDDESMDGAGYAGPEVFGPGRRLDSTETAPDPAPALAAAAAEEARRAALEEQRRKDVADKRAAFLARLSP